MTEVEDVSLELPTNKEDTSIDTEGKVEVFFEEKRDNLAAEEKCATSEGDDEQDNNRFVSARALGCGGPVSSSSTMIAQTLPKNCVGESPRVLLLTIVTSPIGSRYVTHYCSHYPCGGLVFGIGSCVWSGMSEVIDLLAAVHYII